MIDIILHGCNGRMGKVLQQFISEDPGLQIICGIDQYQDPTTPFPVYSSAKDCSEKADVVIDFSNHAAVPDLIEFCKRQKIGVVVATTALNEECKSMVFDAANEIPVFYSANMSLGINVLIKALKEITGVLEENFNIEIIEKHHTKKADSPSGTALLLADTINDACQVKKEYLYGRHSKNDACQMTDLGIHAVRSGTIAGEHTVIFGGPDEVIELKHLALSRNIFATGALKAAKFLAGKGKGMYSMEELIK